MKAQRARVDAPGRRPSEPPTNRAQAWNSAIKCHQGGQLEEAKAAYKKIIRVDPERSCYALNNLGLIVSGEGNPDAARMLFARSAAMHANYADPLNNLGNLHRLRGEFDQAQAFFEKAKAASPSTATTYINLGTLWEARGEPERAIESYRDGIHKSPQTRETYVNLGALLERLGRVDEAENCYEDVLAVDPDYAPALNSLAMIAKSRGDFDTALACLERALKGDPDYGYTYLNLGFLYEWRGNLDRAIQYYREGMRMHPDSAEGYLNLGGALQRTFAIEEAMDCYRRAIELRPNFPDPYSNLGIALKSEGRFAEALATLNKALEIDPDHHDTLMNLGNTYTALGRFDEAAASYERVLTLRPDKATARGNMLLALNYPDTVSAQDMARHSFRIAEWMDQDGLANRSPEPLRPSMGRRLKVGYVSPDFRRHATNYFFESLLREHDRSEVEIYCYAAVDVPDATTARFQSMADHWRSTMGLTDNEVAAQIRADGINVLVDLAGHSGANRLGVFTRRPAPVQMTWLGYPGTTGLKSVDYRIVDAITDPPGEADPLSSETLIRIDGGFLCYNPPPEAPEPAPPPYLANGYVTFGSFNNLTKLSDSTMGVWGRVLAAVPGSKLLLKSAQLGGESRQRIMGRLVAHGVPEERIVLLGGGETTADHLDAYRNIDIALDPFPYNGTTTTCETLWMGVPTVALAGDSHRSRVGASLLTRVGCAELIARDHDDYVRIAAELAADPARQADLRQTLRARMAASSLCDAPAFARKIEAEYRSAWRRWCESNDVTVPEYAPEQQAAREVPVTVRLADGVSLLVPPTLESITTYVILEQGNWFEKEAGFTSRWLRPGMTAIDIGACLGVYSLPMARDVGPDGRVFAYEPATAAFGLLTRSREMNGADNLVLVQAALSDRAGTGRLSRAATAEANTLLGSGIGESVAVTSLDDEDGARDWGSPDFVKIDAVGNEAAVLRGGAGFFERHSPLVMFSVRNDNVDPLPACRILTSLGYGLYRLLPGEPVLVPHDADSLDVYEMNLFAAKPDRAASMAGDGWLVEALPEWAPDDDDLDGALEPLRRLGCAEAGSWLLAEESLLDQDYLAGLAAFAVWRSAEAALPVRAAALDFAWRSLLALNKRSSTVARLVTLVRVAWEAGERAVSVQALRHLIAVTAGRPFVVDEPFWPVAARFDDVVPRTDIQDRIVASAKEQLELTGHFSSVYTRLTPELEWLSARGNVSAEIERRLVLVKARTGKQGDVPLRLQLSGADAELLLSGGVLYLGGSSDGP